MLIRNLFLLAVLLLAAGCGPKTAPRPACPHGKLCLHRGNVSEPNTLDPQKSTGVAEDNIQSDLMVGLVADDAEGRPVPGVAQSWSTSADGLVWTFRLRESQWSDGVPLTSDDFVFALRRLLDPRTAAQSASLLYVIKNAQAVNRGDAPPEALGVRAPDPATLEVTLEHPAPYLLQLAKHHTFYPVPRHAVERWGDDWVRPGRLVSNGPYVLAEWRLGDYVRAVKNPRFWDADKVCYDQVFYYPTADAVAAERRVLDGELDLNTDIQSNRIAWLRARPASAPFVRVHTYLGTAYLAFDSGAKTPNPALRDRRVRQALSMAIDRDFITRKLLRGGQVAAYSFVPPGVDGYTGGARAPWADWPLARRQAEARRLLAEAGYGGDHPLRLELKHRNTPDPMLTAPAIQADWRAVGVRAELAQEEVQIAYQDYRIRNFDIADAAWIADYDDAMSFLYVLKSSTGAQNYGDYANPAYDALIVRAENQADPGERGRLMAEAERLMLEDAPVAPIFFYVSKSLVSPAIDGWRDNISDRHRTRWLCPRKA